MNRIVRLGNIEIVKGKLYSFSYSIEFKGHIDVFVGRWTGEWDNRDHMRLLSVNGNDVLYVAPSQVRSVVPVVENKD